MITATSIRVLLRIHLNLLYISLSFTQSLVKKTVGFTKPATRTRQNPCPWLRVRVSLENPRVARDIP
jgi:hypothetical protein